MSASSFLPLKALHLVLEFARPYDALEQERLHLMKRAIAACIGLGDKHRGNVSLIGRFLLSALHQRRLGDA